MNYLASIEENTLTTDYTICLQIGDVRCALQSRDTEIFPGLKQLFRGYLTSEPPDITIELVEGNQLVPDNMTEAISENKFIHGNNQFKTTSNLLSGQYDLEHRTIHFTGLKNLIDPKDEFNHLNKMLTLSYYSACKVKYGGNPPSMLVHACGLISHGKALLFTGPSEAGKTTTARLLNGKDGMVINDEILLVSRPALPDNVITAQSAPILSDFSLPDSKAPLRCILMLKKGNRTEVRPISQTEAYLKFMRQVITPAYIGQRDRREVYSLIADFSAEITGNIPVFELEFTLDKGNLRRTISQLEKTLIDEEV